MVERQQRGGVAAGAAGDHAAAHLAPLANAGAHRQRGLAGLPQARPHLQVASACRGCAQVAAGCRT